MNPWTQFGIAGAALGIVAFIVKYFTDEQKQARKDSKELTEKFIQVTEKATEAQNKSSQATDKLTEMIYQVIKK